jgi:hypothetical protein
MCRFLSANYLRKQAKYAQINAIADIPKIYYALCVEINGSLAYQEAFKARYEGTLTRSIVSAKTV